MAARTSAFRRILYTDPGLRVSDAERNEVADLLARHYGDGRLTQEEFDERVSRAMSAKTQSDLDGLLTDLPDLGEPGPRSGVPAPSADRPPARRPRRHPVLAAALAVLLVLAVAHGLDWNWLALAVIAAIVVCLIRAFERGCGRRDRTP